MVEPWQLLAGGLVVALASFVGGATGFGFSLVATPLLLSLVFLAGAITALAA